MNANRKADLQRKLTLVPLPKPPAGLAERIKTEIPKHLRFDAERERERLSQSVAFNIRVAASILILISCAYLAMQVLTRLDQRVDQRVDQQNPQRPATSIALKRDTPALAPAPAAVPQQAPAPRKLATRTRAKKQNVAPVAVAAPPPPVAAVAEAAPAREEAKVRTAATGAVSRMAMRDQMNKSVAQTETETEVTTSPISGKVMMRRGDQVEIDPAAADAQKKLEVVAWKDASAKTKTAILKAELAAGGDAKAIAAAARAAGLDELADSIEKQKH
jgi:hypothetical protein